MKYLFLSEKKKGFPYFHLLFSIKQVSRLWDIHVFPIILCNLNYGFYFSNPQELIQYHEQEAWQRDQQNQKEAEDALNLSSILEQTMVV